MAVTPTAMAACASLPAGRPATSEPFVIVGAGAAGLTAAYKLGEAGVPVVLYEASGRVGGRIWTFHGFNADGQFIELGAELVDKGHTELKQLCKKLGLKMEKFRDPPDGVVGELFYYGGRTYTGQQLEHGLEPLRQAVRRARHEIAGAKPPSVTYKAPMNGAAYDRMTLAEFLDRQTGVDGWIREAVRIAYVGEMGSEADAQSALNLILLMDPDKEGLYGDSDECCRIAGGNSSMIEALREAVVRHAGGSPDAVLRLRHELIAIRDDGRQLVLSFDHGGQRVTVPASRVLLTLPFSVLRHVDGIAALGLDPVKKRSIAEYGYGTNTKLMSDFSSRIWRTPSNHVLRPYHGALSTDAGHQSFWDTSREQAGEHGILTNFLGGKAGAAFSAAAQRKPIEFLAGLDPRTSQAFTGLQRFMNWSQYRFALGSYSSPRPGHYTSFYGVEAQPELGERLLFAGEHTSIASSGFMNGAVESGLRAAQEVLGRAA